MDNHWIKSNKEKLAKAKVLFKKWCEASEYDKNGYYLNPSKDRDKNVKRQFFWKYPEYKKFEKELRESLSSKKHFDRCVEISQKARGN